MSEVRKDSDKKASVSENLGLLRYGASLANRMAPRFMPLTLALSFASTLQPMAALFFSVRILNELADGGSTRLIALYAALTVGLTFVISIAKALLTRAKESTASSDLLLHRLRMMVAERFARMDYAYAEDGNISERLARMDTHARSSGLGLLNIYKHITSVADQAFPLVFSILLLGPLAPDLGSFSGWSGFGLMALFALGLLVTLKYRSREKDALDRIYADTAKANTAAAFYSKHITADQAAKDVRLYDQAAMVEGIFHDSFNIKAWHSFFMFEGRLNGFSVGMLALLGGSFYLFAGLGALDGAGSIGGIVQRAGAVIVFAEAIGTLVSLWGQIYNNASFIKPLRDYLTLPDRLVKGVEPLPPPNQRRYEFEFRNVSFRYPNTDIYALKDLNLTIHAGQRLAVVGLNGSGKTTMIKLLCRFYDPTEGEILLDGINIQKYEYNQYTALFSIVFQDFSLFPLLLGQNVAAGEQGDRERLNDCLSAAGFQERLRKMPQGLDTVLYKRFDEEGTQISGGEAQKIAMARALYKDAPVVVMDEPTAALDPIAEYEVYTTFDKTIGGKTAVFISHRLASCRFCHDIAVFDGGRLVQHGSHDALLSDAAGRYRALWNAQAKHYGEEAAG